MNVLKHGPHAAGWAPTRRATWLVLPVILLAVALTGSAEAGTATAVPLGTAQSFVVLAGAGVSDTGPTTLNGDLGTYPTTTINGTGTVTDNGTNHGGDAVTQGAQSDLTNAFTVAAGEGPTSPIVTDLGGQTLTPGIYNSATSIGLTGALTLDGGGNPDAVFLFQAGSTLTTASASQINLIGGAQSCNIFWQVGSSATLGTGSSFLGTVIALDSITVTTGVSINGRVLARNGAVTLDTDTITNPTCAAPPSTPDTTSSTPATTTTATTPTATTPVAISTLPLINASVTRLAAIKAAKAAKAAATRALAAKAASRKATAAATAATARVALAKSQAAKAAARKAATAKTLAAKAAAAKSAKLARAFATKTAAAKTAAANAAALRLAAAKRRATTTKKAGGSSTTTASSQTTPAGHARIALTHVGLTG